MGTPFHVESWIWYASGVFIVACRILARTLNFGSIKKLKIDDWLMLLALACYTTLIVVINEVYSTKSNLIAPGEDVNAFSPEERAERMRGSKLVLVVEQMQCVTIWMLKACLLFLYNRLTLNLPANLAVKLLSVYVLATFVIMEILYLAVWCRPFSAYWALPTLNSQCSTATHHLITNAAFNISSDVAMLTLGFSLFLRSSLPWNRKAILGCIFGVGVFVILAAVLNKYYSFRHPYGSAWTYWYVRESSTALLVANLPFMWPLLRRVFPLDAFDHDLTVRSIPYHSQRTARARHAPQRHSGSSGRNGWTGASASHKPRSQHSSLDMTQLQLPLGPADHTRPHSPPQSHAHSSHSHSHAHSHAIAHAFTSLHHNSHHGHHTNLHKPTSFDSRSSIAPLKPAKVPSWREQGLFGREDLDALGVLDEDDVYERRGSRTGTGDSGGSGESSGDGRSRYGRRIRDEEAQWKLQEGLGSRGGYWKEEEEESEQSEEKKEAV
ncbi:hypothetical protein EJ06DRAFT_552412 [Trichodelitschia bisporula]|uniref:Rhodopsin domain-containing protein n=1 Tax=Trichodelitschia bisporula TaxID=703511 RepID=A0A6G1I9H9_9PEZI|nr:hypothetical protein EJ06DRAFT_552412 [Trichodelitschia bisporula]